MGYSCFLEVAHLGRTASLDMLWREVSAWATARSATDSRVVSVSQSSVMLFRAAVLRLQRFFSCACVLPRPYQAHATTCVKDQCDRPIFGVINFCKSKVSLEAARFEPLKSMCSVWPLAVA